MANRNTLHISKLDEFKEWLIADGWTITDHSKNAYAVLRAEKKSVRKNPLIVYKKNNSEEHLSVADHDYPVVRAFLNSKKASKI